MKKNVLVFPCGSEIGLDIHRLVRFSRYFHLVGGSSIEDHGKFVYEDYVSGIPYVTDEDFINSIKQIIKDKNISIIYPTMDLVITILKRHEEELGLPIVGASLFTTEICLSKRATYECLRDTVLVSKIIDHTSAKEFPVFIKPNIGYGSRGTNTIYTRAELDTALQKEEDLLVLEFLPGEEYTVDCFTDRNKNLLYAKARIRNRTRNGISVNTSFVSEQEPFLNIAKKINLKLDFRGAWFIQVKRDKEGQLCLLEIASRLGGSSLLSNALGCNLALLSLFDIVGFDVAVKTNTYEVEMDRALGSRYHLKINFKTVYVDYDDCLVLEKSFVNIELVQFLYKCINEKKKVILLSKHEGDLSNNLHKFRLFYIFDEIIHLNSNQQKSNFIKNAESIFIDDSFAEREAVRVKKGIPVFSPEMVYVLC